MVWKPILFEKRCLERRGSRSAVHYLSYLWTPHIRGSMNPKFVRLAATFLCLVGAGTSCRSAVDVAPVPAFDPAPRFTCVSNDAAVDAPAQFKGIVPSG